MSAADDASVPAPSEALPVETQDRVDDQIECAKQPSQPSQPAFLHSPPDSNNAGKSEPSDSELSDLEGEPPLEDAPKLPPDLGAEEDDIGEPLPDHWSSGNVPVFKPTMKQFRDFKRYMEKIDHYGMKSGIVKISPPDEWLRAQPCLDDLVKHIRIREPIKQDIMGSNGTYRQVNIVHGRSYNIVQWKQLCEQSEHQPPARRGERRANADKPRPVRTRAAASKVANPTTQRTRGRGRPPKNKGKQKGDEESRPMTPVSPRVEAEGAKDEVMDSIEKELGTEADHQDDDQPIVRRMGGVRPAKPKIQSISARRKYSRREGSAVIDEAAFKDFDYRMDISDYTPERCEELERVYWKTLTYAPPLYGADLMGTLFDEKTECWNLNKLPNLLDVLGTKVPGVNTAYLYLGMWKATFAWHLEDVDLYSINYLHFGAPKQWYSISQADARKFEAAMKSIWPADAKACDQFLRHKAFLISPQHLQQNYGIKVNKVVSYPGEFVVTYPYGYHSGYNLGYNCAEAVNFALDSWLDMGKIAKKCDCAQAQDSVWVNVYEIERKLRGEETEYEETEEEDEDDEDEDDELSGLPTPPAGHGVKFKDVSRKRKRGRADKGTKVKVKKIRLRLKVKAEPPCCLCPNDILSLEILPTDDGRKAHRLCALYIPETYIDTVDGKEIISNVAAIHKDRLDLKCLFCRSKRGACFQCSQKKCARAYHATCAAAAGVFTEEQEVPVFGEDGTEYKEQAFEFSCRFHRTKRNKNLESVDLEADVRVMKAAEMLQKGDICQLQYLGRDIFAGLVVENRPDERMLLIDVLPHGDRLEVDWKWLLLPDPSDYHLPKASANAIPLPSSQKAKEKLNAKRHHEDDKPRKDDVFVEGGFSWAEFHTGEVTNKQQAKVDLAKEDQIWYYLGKTSTEARAQYTEDPSKPRHNTKGNFLDTIPKPPKPAPARPVYQQRAYGLSGPFANSGAAAGHMAMAVSTAGLERPYNYQPRVSMGHNYYLPGTYSFQGTNAAGAAAPVLQQHQSYAVQRFDRINGPSGMPQAHAPAPLQAPHSVSTVGRPSVAHTSQRTTASGQAPLHYNKPNWQVHSSVYQKYPFFQVNHNREASKYRTPYSPWGGFTNGYEGDLRAHLLANQNDLLRRASLTAMSPISSLGPYQALPSSAPSNGLATTSTVQQQEPLDQQTTSSLPTPILGTASHQYHPAIKAQYRNLAQQQPSKPKPTPTPKSYKVPSKQSPVPLPANFLAAMTSSPGTPTPPSSCKPSPLQPASPQVGSPSTKAAAASSPSSPSGSATPVGPIPKPAQQPQRISTTPVPLPRFSKSYQGNTVASTPSPAKAELSNLPRPQEPASSGDQTPGVAASQGSIYIPQEVATPSNTNPSSTNSNVISNMHMPTALVAPTSTTNQQTGADQSPQSCPTQLMADHQPEGFPDVPGCESMELVERMMENLRRASQRRDES